MIASQTEPKRAPAEPRDRRPSISVVIPSLGGLDSLDACLDALAQQTLSSEAEVIVVDCGVAGIEDLVHSRYPQTKLLSFTEPKSIPEMRALGLKHSQGAIVTITEDHCVPESHWFERILSAHKARHGVIGGAVENDPSITRLVDWAVFFCEYVRYMNPVADGEVTDLPGNNVSYRREFLAHVSDLLEGGNSWEGDLHARLRERGVILYSDPSIVVYHKKEFALRYFLSQRYHYSRSYTGMRTQAAPGPMRFIRAALCCVLPPILTLRIARWVFGKKRHVGMLFLTLPLILLFTIVWAWGELIGHLFGPGDSLSRVE
jgi:glycosyltransferase involved in cell wall biosynthesis